MLNIPNKIKEIENVGAGSITPELLTSQEPFIVRGMINHWPLVNAAKVSNRNADEYLRQFYNGTPVFSLVADSKFNGRYFYNDDLCGFNFERKKLQLTDVLDKINGVAEDMGSTYYVGSTSVEQILPGMRADNDLPQVSANSLVSIWIGDRSRIAAHYDIPDNLACVAAGKRRFTLFPPEQLDNLYIGPLDYTPAGQATSLVDFESPDFERFPKFKQAVQSAKVAELEAGDVIFIPSMWWHHVEGLSEFNILVNYWWRQVDLHIGSPMDALNHALLSIRELPENQRDIWRDIFEYYVFSPQEQTHIPESKRGVLNPIDDNLSRQLRAVLLNKLNR